MENKIKLKNIAFVDIETSGLNPNCDEVVLFQAMIICPNSHLTFFNEYAKPAKPLKKYVEAFINITNDMLKDSRPSSEVKKEFVKLISDCIIVANNKKFLESFLNIEISMFINYEDFYSVQFKSEEMTQFINELSTKFNITNELQNHLKCDYTTARIVKKYLN